MMRRALLRSRAAAAGLLVGAAALTGCGSSSSAVPASSAGTAAYDEPVLKVTGAYIPQPPTSDMAAGYFTVTNTGRQPRLTGVTSDIATTVTMHRTTAKEQMMPVKAFTIPAGGTLRLRIGGNHLMLTGLKRKPKAGDTVTLQLRFAASDTITVRAPVKPATYQPPN